MSGHVDPVTGPGALAAVLARRTGPAVLATLLAAVVAPGPLRLLAVATAALLLGAALHESGHALAHWHLHRGRSRESVLVLSRAGLPLAVRAEGPVSRRVAAAGPAGAGAVGLLVLGVAVVTGLPVWWAVALPLVLHVAGLVPGCSDGDVVWGLADDGPAGPAPAVPVGPSAVPVAQKTE